MPSTFFGLNIAYTGLTAANAGLNTTANNISNVNTEGYSRQTVTQQASNALRTYTTYGCAGSGVDTTAIERQRDAFYDFKYWNNNAQLGEYEELQYYMKQIEDYFKDDTTVDGFATIFEKMYTTIEELKKNSGDATTKEQFLGYAGNLTYYFNTMAANLEHMQTDVNLEIKNKIEQINSYATEIASLNKQINVIELTGATANELRDQRDLIIDNLSKIVDTTIDEQPVYDTNNPDRETGATRYVVKIAGGQTLVDSDRYNELVCEARTNYASNNQSDAVGLYNIYWNDGREFSVYSDQIGGELRGLIEIRDGNNGENFQGTVQDVSKNASGQTTVTVDVTADYLKSLATCTLPENGGVLRLGNQEYYFDDFSVTYDANGDIKSYTFTISDDPTKNTQMPDSGRVGKDASVGYTVDYQGIPYYQEQLNEWVRIFAEAFNNIITQDGSVDGYGNEADIVFVADEATDNTQRRFLDSRQDITDGTVISSTGDSYYYLTAKNFNVNSDMTNDPQKLATHTGETEGESKSDVVDDLIQLKTDTSMMSFRGCSAGDFLQCVLADVALNAQSANTLTTSYQNIANSIDNQRLSVSGVDSDEEALNLVQFQHSYNLASQMISVLTEVYDRLILETGV
jgi:flagellar hook-associated protein 1 FlgK